MTRTQLTIRLPAIAALALMAADVRAHHAPQLGRFLQRDPAGYVDGAHTYQYVRSQPVRAVDPNGLRTRSGYVWNAWGRKLEVVFDSDGWGRCTVSQQNRIQEAIRDGLNNLGRANAQMKSMRPEWIHDTGHVAVRAVNKWFPMARGSWLRWQDLIGRTQTFEDRIFDGIYLYVSCDVNCEPPATEPCQQGLVGHSLGQALGASNDRQADYGGHRIVFCAPWFRESARQRTRWALHEMTHRYLGTSDVLRPRGYRLSAYFDEGRGEYYELYWSDTEGRYRQWFIGRNPPSATFDSLASHADTLAFFLLEF